MTEQLAAAAAHSDPDAATSSHRPLQESPGWASETIPGLSVRSIAEILELQERPASMPDLRRRFAAYRVLLWSRGILRTGWILFGIGVFVAVLWPSWATVYVPVAAYVMPTLILAAFVYWSIRLWMPGTIQVDRVVRAVAFASSLFERERPLDAAEQRRYVLAGVRFGRAVFGMFTGSVWQGHSLPQLENQALEVACNVTWKIPMDFRSWTAAERTEQLDAARTVVALIFAGDLQQTELFARRTAARHPEFFVGAVDDSERDRYFEALGPGLTNRRLRAVMTGVVPWIGLLLTASSLVISLTFNLINVAE